MFWKKNAHHAKENELGRESLLSSSKATSNRKGHKFLQLFQLALTKNWKRHTTVKERNPTRFSHSIAHCHGGNWIFPLLPQGTNWNCSANLCPHEWLSHERNKDLKPTQKSASGPNNPRTPGFTWKGEQGLRAAS